MRYPFVIIGRGKKSVKKKNKRQQFQVPSSRFELENLDLFGIWNFEFGISVDRG